MNSVMLYSGGLDSWCMRALHPADVYLYFSLGTADGAKELAAIRCDSAVTVLELNLAQFELPNKILPYRNNILVMLAANYGNEIYLGATEGDSTKDKDYVFSSQMESVLNYFGLDQHKVQAHGYPYRIHMPFKQMTKTEIVAQYLRHHSVDTLRSSRSCYSGDERECGTCRSCIRKAVALYLNNAWSAADFAVDPIEQMLRLTPEQVAKERSRGREGQDFARVYEVAQHAVR